MEALAVLGIESWTPGPRARSTVTVLTYVFWILDSDKMNVDKEGAGGLFKASVPLFSWRD